ncbi:hypothetical protein K501DRAFT_273744 [Backusella circina FSU 941]|nr:hypothetical protein K501DRAFT_273744 [Backusella circina FSU 941]
MSYRDPDVRVISVSLFVLYIHTVTPRHFAHSLRKNGKIFLGSTYKECLCLYSIWYYFSEYLLDYSIYISPELIKKPKLVVTPKQEMINLKLLVQGKDADQAIVGKMMGKVLYYNKNEEVLEEAISETKIDIDSVEEPQTEQSFDDKEESDSDSDSDSNSDSKEAEDEDESGPDLINRLRPVVLKTRDEGFNYTSFSPTVIHIEKYSSSYEKDALHITPAGLYSVFSKTHHIYQTINSQRTNHGNWHSITTYMKSNTQVSCKGYLKRFKSSNDYCKTVDEYASTVNHSNCFRHFRNQVFSRNGKVARISGDL